MLNEVKNEFNTALVLHQEGKLEQAYNYYNKILVQNPNFADCIHHMGIIYLQLGKFELAVEKISKAIEINPNIYSAYGNRGSAYKELKKLEEALADFNQSLFINPNFANGYNNRGIVLVELDHFEKGISDFKKALQIQPNMFEAFNNLGKAQIKKNNNELAIKSFTDAIRINNSYFEAYSNRGYAKLNLKNNNEAIIDFNKAITINPEYAEAYIGQSLCFLHLEQLNKAIDSSKKALLIRPDFIEAINNYGIVLSKMSKPTEALNYYNKAIMIDKNYYQAYINRAEAFTKLCDFDNAFNDLQTCLSINPNNANAYINLGSVFQKRNRHKHALQNYLRAISIKPNSFEAYNNIGSIYFNENNFKEALTNFNKSIKINPFYTDAYLNKGHLYRKNKEYVKAIGNYEKVLSISPNYEFVQGILFHTKMVICDWKKFDENLELYKSEILIDNKNSYPFSSLSILNDPKGQKLISENYIAKYHPFKKELGPLKKYNNKKIRIGYFSTDFGEHPVSYLIAELFELHNRKKFEIIGFYYGSNQDNNMFRRIKSSFDEFINITSQSDKEAAKLSREMNIDIAVDLTGHTNGGRVGIFSYRTAPLQLSYIGFLGTMGSDYYDYLIADKVIIPEQNQKFYTEKIAYLPNYQINDSKREISKKLFSREYLNIPKNSFVFCCFNNNYKITPFIFKIWMQILNEVPESVLFLYADNIWAKENLLKEASYFNINSNRVIFASRVIREEYLARYRVADLFLDTYPYNAGTTASDALWTGLPVLTYSGNNFAGRVCSSILSSIGLDELITNCSEDYKNLAVELATHPAKMKRLKLKLIRNIKEKPLFDSQLFTNNIEKLYEVILLHYNLGLKPENKVIK